MSKNNIAISIEESKLKEGKIAAVRVKGRPILLAKVEGKIFGVSNKCPHMGCQLQGGILNGYIIMCPCHGWKFDLRNGQYLEIPEVKLTTYACTVQSGKICIEIKEDE
jgi:nitrite reductase/ring-hydroxylating ferredoxin subunit